MFSKFFRSSKTLSFLKAWQDIPQKILNLIALTCFQPFFNILNRFKIIIALVFLCAVHQNTFAGCCVGLLKTIIVFRLFRRRLFSYIQ